MKVVLIKVDKHLEKMDLKCKLQLQDIIFSMSFFFKSLLNILYLSYLLYFRMRKQNAEMYSERRQISATELFTKKAFSR